MSSSPPPPPPFEDSRGDPPLPVPLGAPPLTQEDAAIPSSQDHAHDEGSVPQASQHAAAGDTLQDPAVEDPTLTPMVATSGKKRSTNPFSSRNTERQHFPPWEQAFLEVEDADDDDDDLVLAPTAVTAATTQDDDDSRLEEGGGGGLAGDSSDSGSRNDSFLWLIDDNAPANNHSFLAEIVSDEDHVDDQQDGGAGIEVVVVNVEADTRWSHQDNEPLVHDEPTPDDSTASGPLDSFSGSHMRPHLLTPERYHADGPRLVAPREPRDMPDQLAQLLQLPSIASSSTWRNEPSYQLTDSSLDAPSDEQQCCGVNGSVEVVIATNLSFLSPVDPSLEQGSPREPAVGLESPLLQLDAVDSSFQDSLPLPSSGDQAESQVPFLLPWDNSPTISAQGEGSNSSDAVPPFSRDEALHEASARPQAPHLPATSSPTRRQLPTRPMSLITTSAEAESSPVSSATTLSQEAPLGGRPRRSPARPKRNVRSVGTTILPRHSIRPGRTNIDRVSTRASAIPLVADVADQSLTSTMDDHDNPSDETQGPLHDDRAPDDEINELRTNDVSTYSSIHSNSHSLFTTQSEPVRRSTNLACGGPSAGSTCSEARSQPSDQFQSRMYPDFAGGEGSSLQPRYRSASHGSGRPQQLPPTSPRSHFRRPAGESPSSPGSNEHSSTSHSLQTIPSTQPRFRTLAPGDRRLYRTVVPLRVFLDEIDQRADKGTIPNEVGLRHMSRDEDVHASRRRLAALHGDRYYDAPLTQDSLVSAPAEENPWATDPILESSLDLPVNQTGYSDPTWERPRFLA
jgi:hypothetical protein